MGEGDNIAESAGQGSPRRATGFLGYAQEVAASGRQNGGGANAGSDEKSGDSRQEGEQPGQQTAASPNENGQNSQEAGNPSGQPQETTTPDGGKEHQVNPEEAPGKLFWWQTEKTRAEALIKWDRAMEERFSFVRANLNNLPDGLSDLRKEAEAALIENDLINSRQRGYKNEKGQDVEENVTSYDPETGIYFVKITTTTADGKTEEKIEKRKFGKHAGALMRALKELAEAGNEDKNVKAKAQALWTASLENQFFSDRVIFLPDGSVRLFLIDIRKPEEILKTGKHLFVALLEKAVERKYNENSDLMKALMIGLGVLDNNQLSDEAVRIEIMNDVLNRVVAADMGILDLTLKSGGAVINVSDIFAETRVKATEMNLQESHPTAKWILEEMKIVQDFSYKGGTIAENEGAILAELSAVSALELIEDIEQTAFNTQQEGSRGLLSRISSKIFSPREEKDVFSELIKQNKGAFFNIVRKIIPDGSLAGERILAAVSTIANVNIEKLREIIERVKQLNLGDWFNNHGLYLLIAAGVFSEISQMLSESERAEQQQ